MYITRLLNFTLKIVEISGINRDLINFGKVLIALKLTFVSVAIMFTRPKPMAIYSPHGYNTDRFSKHPESIESKKASLLTLAPNKKVKQIWSFRNHVYKNDLNTNLNLIFDSVLPESY